MRVAKLNDSTAPTEATLPLSHRTGVPVNLPLILTGEYDIHCVEMRALDSLQVSPGEYDAARDKVTIMYRTLSRDTRRPLGSFGRGACLQNKQKPEKKSVCPTPVKKSTEILISVSFTTTPVLLLGCRVMNIE